MGTHLKAKRDTFYSETDLYEKYVERLILSYNLIRLVSYVERTDLSYFSFIFPLSVATV
jgi:hypothetical protein